MIGRSPADELQRLKLAGLGRSLNVAAGCGGKFMRDGRVVLNFSSNDYLALAGDDRLGRAAVRAVRSFGCSASASRLMSGSLELHAALEDRLASWTGMESALVFGSGFLANLGVITVLAGRGGVIFADRLVHTSLLDGARLSGARLIRYRHNDADDLARLLAANPADERLIVTESVFSMDGDVAPLERICLLGGLHGATVVVDEAHAVGVFGRGGAGVLATLDLDRPPDVIVATLSKALGSYGGFVASSSAICELLVNRARSFIYSTALPPASAGAALAALDVLQERPDMGPELLRRAELLRKLLVEAGLDVGKSRSQIVPVIVGANDDVLAVSADLARRGIIATAVRPPTVPAGRARLRLSVTLAHDDADLIGAAGAVARACREVSAK